MSLAPQAVVTALVPPMLTVHVFVWDACSAHAPIQADWQALCERLQEQDMRCVRHARQAQPPMTLIHEPMVMVSVGGDAQDFPELNALPWVQRRGWLHVPDVSRVDPNALLNCWLSATDPFPAELTAHPPKADLPPQPLVSVLTAAYRSGPRLQRAYQSLLAQTYPHWEWIVVDDSGDDCATFRDCIAPLDDPRVVKVMLAEHMGRIGSVKRMAASMGRGHILLELDHDDELMPDALQRLLEAFLAHPQAGFVFGECAEVYEETGLSHWYGWDAGFGYSMYWRQWDALGGQVVSVQRTPDINARTVQHLVGLPNHPRAWTRSLYDAVGGYRAGLTVADDYDLLMRSFLLGRFVRVPHLLYRQYRNAGGQNTTFIRNRQIQRLCAALERYYSPRTARRLADLQLPPTRALPFARVWTCADADPRWATAGLCHVGNNDSLPELWVLPYGDTQVTQALEAALQQAQAMGWQCAPMVVVGNVPELRLEELAAQAPPGVLRWWRMARSWPLADMLRYGRQLGAGLPRVVHGVDAGISAKPSKGGRPSLRYVDRFGLATPADQGFDRLHVLHALQQRFGYRAYLEIGTDTDEVFSQMTGLDLKVGVDPNSGGNYRMTSDAYFEQNRRLPEASRSRFDLIFIDGLHEYQQVLRDVDNALECLLPGGTIVLHDCMPSAQLQQQVPRPKPHSFWTGDVWKAIFDLRARPEVDVAVGCFDWGVAVLRVRSNSRPLVLPPGIWDWQFYITHCKEGLYPLGYDDLLRWVGVDTPEKKDCDANG
ncbi:glycosyltransferase [Limnohabitans sp. WS1]|uniref:glycosyltransferase n=1 Tax=Limnohabitans sp. WS1 TaxID=1100726 RepID=UPI00130489C8|nr:glycosyltransferase [Limnohabitans sp. WS1]